MHYALMDQTAKTHDTLFEVSGAMDSSPFQRCFYSYD